MKYITFLFGAGASCQRMPLNVDISNRVDQCIELLKEAALDNQDKKDELISDLKWISEEASNHASIDTYAKKLYIKRDFKKLKILRLALSVFFSLEQIGKIPDKRYDSFFASILDDSPGSLPINIKILNWNYDFQFEISFIRFADVNLIEAQNYLGCVRKTSSYYTDHFNNDRFQLFKLNGDCSITEGESSGTSVALVNDISTTISKQVLSEIIERWYNHKRLRNDFCANISFAWERSGNGFLEYVQKKIVKTDILVVIGYSFPFFNREIDMSLIQHMPNLSKVYLQSPQASDIKDRFQAMNDRGIAVKQIFDVGQFFIPYEFSKSS